MLARVFDDVQHPGHGGGYSFATFLCRFSLASDYMIVIALGEIQNLFFLCFCFLVFEAPVAVDSVSLRVAPCFTFSLH